MNGYHSPSDRAEAGFTLIEAVVALTLSVIVAGLVASAYLFAIRSVADWQDRLDLEDTAHVLHQRLTADLRRAEVVQMVGSDSLEIRMASGPHTYAVRDSTLFRDGLAMVQPPLSVRTFVVEREASPAAGDATNTVGPLVRVRVMLAQGDRMVEQTAVATLRSPERWPSSLD